MVSLLAKLRSVAPGLRVGAVQAERNETLARVIVATVQTLRNDRRRAMLRDIGLIICDEAHHAVAVTYRTIFNHFGAEWSKSIGKLLQMMIGGKFLNTGLLLQACCAAGVTSTM